MSTITKLDPIVRRERALRLAMRREMVRDLSTIASFIVRGKRQLAIEEVISKNPAYSAMTRKLLKEMYVRQTVLRMMLKHITKICLDSSRTGERKDAILSKLSGESARAAA